MVKKRKHGDNRRPPRRGGGRGISGATWLYGWHAVRAALANPARRPRRLLVADPDAALPADLPINPEATTRETIAQVLPPGAVHQGIALECDPLQAVALEDFCAEAGLIEAACALVLDQVTDPQNVGAVLRSAAFFGAAAVILPERHAPPATGALAKAASGALETVPLIRVANIARALELLKRAGFWCAGLDAAAPVTMAEAALSGPTALVLGAEGGGLRRLTRESCDVLVRIAAGGTDRADGADGADGAVASLNVSAAASIALYELTRALAPGPARG